MLVLTMTLGNTDEDVIVRDREGRIVCEIVLSDISHARARIGYTAPDHVHINRRTQDAARFTAAAGYQQPAPLTGTKHKKGGRNAPPKQGR